MSAPQNSNNINLNPLDALHLETLNCLYGQAQNVSMQFPFPTLPASVPSPLPLPMHFSPPEANMNIMPMMLPPFQGFGNITSMPMAQATYPSTMPLYVQTEPSPPQAQMQFNHFYAQPPPPPPPPMPDYPPPPPPPPFGCNDNVSLNFNAAAGHTFINGALYNTEYLAPSGPEYGSNMGMGCGTEHNDSDDDFYDPMSERALYQSVSQCVGRESVSPHFLFQLQASLRGAI
ncbi:ras-associated and pleckstrin homology domains-containing protein 1 isoform X2 [Drosophila busckii]|uniref:ras-associated and pleckstrin homology domains-containing protein 1 isoform X2 n=1 Tax=Drosophila busckii TaxID=30019 RepID=UPI00083F3038|nr:ras-associated and pleckstrin homology domains-containing protein 1 isoform X2 [Drosophila busckii]